MLPKTSCQTSHSMRNLIYRTKTTHTQKEMTKMLVIREENQINNHHQLTHLKSEKSQLVITQEVTPPTWLEVICTKQQVKEHPQTILILQVSLAMKAAITVAVKQNVEYGMVQVRKNCLKPWAHIWTKQELATTLYHKWLVRKLWKLQEEISQTGQCNQEQNLLGSQGEQ